MSFRVFGGLEVQVTKSICPQNTRKTPKSQRQRSIDLRKNLRYLRPLAKAFGVALLLEKDSSAAGVTESFRGYDCSRFTRLR